MTQSNPGNRRSPDPAKQPRLLHAIVKALAKFTIEIIRTLASAIVSSKGK